jgi:hypothetical protein
MKMAGDVVNDRRKREARSKIPFLVRFGNEGDIIAYTKRWNPGISEEQLERVVTLFRAAQLARVHPQQPH